jgi:RNA polymerase sigma factor (sigma-70 family)
MGTIGTAHGTAFRVAGTRTDPRLEAATPRLTRIALALGVRAQDVPDVVQDSLLAAHRARGGFEEGRGTFESWLATILVRRVRNARRAERRRQALRTVLSILGGREPATRSDIARIEARLVLDRLVSCLTDTQREVVALYEIGELPAEEVARTLGCTAAGVRSIARDARTKLSQAARHSEGRR